MRMKKLLALLLCVMMMLSTFGMLTATAATQIKNIIYMIPDGGGMVPFNLADAVKQAGGVNAKFPNSTPQTVDYMYLKDYLVAAETTYSYNQAVTDSAAGGTALSTGYKTNNNTIGLDSSLRPHATILEAAQYIGKRAGLVTTYPWVHATPAAFSAHALDRYDYRTISEQQINQGLDVVLPFNGTGAGSYDEAAEDIAAHGYSSVASVDEMLALESGAKVWGTLGGDFTFFNRDIYNSASYPTLAEMTKAAIQALEGSEEGFFLMVEGSAVDGGGHASNGLDMVTEFIAFDEACKVAIEYAKGRTDTVVVAAPDHDTGGMNVLDQAAAISNIQNGVIPGTSVMTWDGNGSHTGRNGGVFMYVPDGVTRLPGTSHTPGEASNWNNYVINNIDIAPWLASLIGVDLDEITEQLFVDVSALGTYTPTSDTYWEYEDQEQTTTSDYTGYFTFNDYDLVVERNTSEATFNGQEIDLEGQVCVYSGGRFYVPQILLDKTGIEFDRNAVVIAPSSLTGSTLAGSVVDNLGCSVGNDSISIYLSSQSTSYITLEIGVSETAYYDVQAMLTSSNGNLLCNGGLTGTFEDGTTINFAAGSTKGSGTWMSDSSSSVALAEGNHTLTIRSGDLCSNIYIYGIQLVKDTSLAAPSMTPVPAPTDDPTPTATPAGVPIDLDVDYTDAPYAGVYQATSDKDVVLYNETGHKAVISAGGTEYIYLLKGSNNLVISDTSANVTFTALEGNGMDCIDNVLVGTIPITIEYCNMGDSVVQGTNIINHIYSKDSGVTTTSTTVTIPAGKSIVLDTGSSTVRGIYYMGVQVTGTSSNSLYVETSGGHYGYFNDLSSTATNGWIQYEDGSAGSDLMMVYMKAGNNYITVKNTGSSSVTLGGMNCARTSTIYSRDYQKDQVALSECQVVPYGDSTTPTPPSATATPAPTATPTPAPTPTLAPNVKVYEAEYAGVYQVTSDTAVTATNETGSTVTLAAGETAYMYMIAGSNLVTLSDTSATLTFTALSGNGLDYADQVNIPSEPIIDPSIDEHDPTSGAEDITLAAGESRSFSHTPNYGAGIYYPYIAGTEGGTLRVTTDTGFYADILLKSNASSSAWADANNTDPEMVYLRDGVQTVTITNTGTSDVYINATVFGTAGCLSEATYWKDQMKMTELKVVPYSVEEEPTPTPVPTDAPSVGGTVAYANAPYAGVYQVTSDKAVTLTNETQHAVTLAAGETGYFYLIKGNNNITVSDATANLTFNELSNNGMDYLAEVDAGDVNELITSVHYGQGIDAPNGTSATQTTNIGDFVVSKDSNVTNSTSSLTMPAGSKVTLKTQSDLPAGLYYMALLTGTDTTNIRVETETGYYGVFESTTAGTRMEFESRDPSDDLLMVYLRAGENQITLINESSASVVINGIRCSRSSTPYSNADLTDQINMANCKVIPYEITEEPEATPTPTPTPTPAPVPEDVVVYNASFAGIYAVTADADVTLTSELGSVATIAAGETKYIYLIKGVNNIETTNTAANVTITALAGQGMAYADQLVMGTEPVISGQEDLVLEELGYSLAPGATYTFTYTPSQGMAGLVYPYIFMRGAGETTLRVTADTGFYADLFRPDWSGSSICWADSAREDIEFVYVRNGENTITIENIGSQTVTLTDIKMHSVGELADHETWGPQLKVVNLKPVLSESEYTDFALDKAAATATVSFTQMGTIADEVVSLIIAEYDAETGKLLQVNIEYIDISEQAIGTTVEYSTSLTGVTGNLKAMLMDENLVPYFTVAD